MNKFAFGTPMTTGLRHQYGISVAESQAFLLTKHVPSGEERGEKDVFAGYVLILTTGTSAETC